MKKVYISPTIEVVDLEVESHLMTASGDLPGTEDGGVNPPSEEWGDANRHRGEWGNLWSNN